MSRRTSTAVAPRRRPLVLFALVTIAALLVTVSPAPAGAATPSYLDEGFSDDPATWVGDWYDNVLGARNRLSSIPDGSDADALSVAIPAGSHFGSALRWRFADHGLTDPTELYFRYYLRFPAGFQNLDRGKLPGPAGLYGTSAKNLIPPTDANPGWSARMLFSPTYTDRDDDHTQIGFYVYHRGQAADEGDILVWDPQVASLRHGDWYCVEGYVGMNTPGAPNGVLTGWVDEALAFYQDDFTFLGAGDAGMGVKEFWFDTYFGGGTPAPTGLSIDYDSLALSDTRIGCGDRAPGSFRDTGSSVHRDNIARLAIAGITKGCNPPDNDRFCPTQRVSRGQMAAFLGRALSLPAAPGDTFTDDDDSIFEADIERLAAAGITKGCGATTFCPDRTVTRGEMAAFLDRALGLPPAPGDRFVDDDDSIFEANIERLAAAGITLGCNPPTNDRFCPNSYVTREQMASFLARALSLPAPPPSPDGPQDPVVPPGYDAVVPVGWSIQAVANSQPEGAKVLIRSGTHYRQTVIPKAGQTFAGELGTVLDGLDERAHAFVSRNGDAVNGVTIDGITVTGYRPNKYEAAIHAEGTGWTVQNCTVRDNDTVGVIVGSGSTIRGCTFARNHHTAIYLDGVSDVLVENNDISFSNDLDRDITISSAGAKFTDTTRLTLRNNTVHDNHGHGLWVYGDNLDTLYDGNTITANYRAGIYHDASYDAVIQNNTVTGNGTHPGAPGDYYKDAGILVAGPNVTVTGNLVSGNFNGIVFYNNNPGTGKYGSHAVYGGTATNNTVIDSGGVGVRDDGDPTVRSTTTFSANDYRYDDITERWWRWEVRRTWAEWQGLGNDTDGTLAPS